MMPTKTTLGLLRDCLKVVPFMTNSNNPKINSNVRSMIMAEFRKFEHLQDEAEIEKKRMIAIKGISNYYVYSVKELYLKEKKEEEEMMEILNKNAGI